MNDCLLTCLLDNAPVTVNLTSSSSGGGSSSSGVGVSVAPAQTASSSSAEQLQFSIVITKLQEVDDQGNVIYALDTNGNTFDQKVCYH